MSVEHALNFFSFFFRFNFSILFEDLCCVAGIAEYSFSVTFVLFLFFFVTAIIFIFYSFLLLIFVVVVVFVTLADIITRIKSMAFSSYIAAATLRLPQSLTDTFTSFVVAVVGVFCIFICFTFHLHFTLHLLASMDPIATLSWDV